MGFRLTVLPWELGSFHTAGVRPLHFAAFALFAHTTAFISTEDLASWLGRGRRFAPGPLPPSHRQDGALTGNSNSRHGSDFGPLQLGSVAAGSWDPVHDPFQLHSHFHVLIEVEIHIININKFAENTQPLVLFQFFKNLA